ncbi:hypothetical protein BMS3Bbin06_01317 [bacterium BMS3Bbin06]|nr:hypothetical protein BMS3Abin08_00078 [bacterium BMS3Abin08]GBE34787.1 hypothetical protein BMS3Bbin06_01317 [bacterium BMS3Bbin06]
MHLFKLLIPPVSAEGFPYIYPPSSILYIVSVYKLPFFILVMSRKRSGHPELIEKTGFRLKDCRNDG